MFSEEITANQEARWRAFGLKTSHANDPNRPVYQRAPVLGHCSPVGCGMLPLPCFPSSCLCVLHIQTPHPGLSGHMFSRLGRCWHDSATAQDSKVQSASSAQFHDPVTEAVTASGSGKSRDSLFHATGVSKEPASQLKAAQAPDRRVAGSTNSGAACPVRTQQDKDSRVLCSTEDQGTSWKTSGGGRSLRIPMGRKSWEEICINMTNSLDQ